jgi:hypothetical protein
MINKLKTFAIALMVTGATVATTRATPVTYVATNILQPVTLTLTVYEQKPVSTPTVASGISFKTKDLLTAVESALGTNAPADGHFSTKAELALLSSNLVTQSGTTNVVTNEVVSIGTNIVLSTNSVVLGGTTNLTIGNTSGSYYVTITATNGTTNLLVTSTTETITGPVSTTTGTSGTTLTLDANQTLAIGTNAAVPVETNAALGGVAQAIDQSAVVILTNGVAISTNIIATNTLVFTSNSVEIGTNITTFTNSSSNIYTVEIVGNASTNIIDTNGLAPGLGASSALTNSLTTTFTVGTNAGGLTNVTIVTSTTDLATNLEAVTNVEPVFSTNTSTELVVADGAVNTPVPTNILGITVHSTNIIGETFSHTDVLTAETEWSIMRLDLDTTAVLTNAADNVTLHFQGLVKSTLQDFAVGKVKVALTNYSWSDISGYGTNNGTPIVVGGTMTVQTPALQKIP